jgi:hypothetical protein
MGASEKDEEEAIGQAQPAKNLGHFECANRRPCA